ncbi:MAG: biotin synthase BioB [Candidatus Polarisedimenticolia bacterium]
MSPTLRDTAQTLYRLPLFDLIERSHAVHRAHHDPADIQRCALLSIKTGGCPEDCAYCPQSAHYETGVGRDPLLGVDAVRRAARAARADGAQRFCMGAAWREVKDGEEFERVLDMVRAVAAEGLEVCATLGMLTPAQAGRLKEAGLHAYNHNLDTSRAHYGTIITTRTYDDRLDTLRAVRAAGLTVCSGGILGMGETVDDRCALLAELASLEPQPESVPINMLVAVPGTPLGGAAPIDPLDLIRTIAVARILMPRSRVRLSAGRLSLGREAQILAFYAGANSIFLGERLLTTPNPEPGEDHALLQALQGAPPGS